MSMLHLEGISVVRGGRAILRDIDARFLPGRLTAVIGPNGAGKSTVLRAAAGLLRPDAGKVRIGDVDLSGIGRRELARRRAYLPQRAGIDWPMRVDHVVALGLLPRIPALGPLAAGDCAAIDRALAACAAEELRDREATSLSGGELARVMLARAIVGDPELLIVDEPTADLDPRHAIDAARRLRALARTGRTVVMAIHDLDLALRFADDVLAIRDGRVVAAGAVEEVMSEALLGALFDVRVRVSRDAESASIRFLD
ncbi:ABC transporter ATP-binding protein [Sphingomonas sp.]|uniref:ABC transporter ATP-binding protein n=1 Tax=Sphingomonas sp. TaxID=28214 RepID=UPI001EBE33FB|nr:ABC transporter ATP-binding protein [Sphingomonas sp.]MBX3593323.1 ABC transporter ATP-binding protein [Sphingomonas sp.]